MRSAGMGALSRRLGSAADAEKHRHGAIGPQQIGIVEAAHAPAEQKRGGLDAAAPEDFFAFFSRKNTRVTF